MPFFAALFLFSSTIAPIDAGSPKTNENAPAPEVAVKSKPKKICKTDDRTGQGSRTAKRICKTAEEWGLVEREAVDSQIDSMGTKTR